MNINKKSLKIANDNLLEPCQIYLFRKAIINCVEIYFPKRFITYLKDFITSTLYTKIIIFKRLIISKQILYVSKKLFLKHIFILNY